MFLTLRHTQKKVLCCAHLTVEEAETNFGAVNHPSIILHIDAALLPAADRVVSKRRIPFDVFYRLQIFRGHFLQPTSHNISSGMSAVKQSDLNLKSERLAQGLKTTAEQFCLACRWMTLCFQSWWRYVPSSGWQCRGYLWCCWTSPVPPGDYTCETSDCCHEKGKLCVNTHSPVFTA